MSTRRVAPISLRCFRTFCGSWRLWLAVLAFVVLAPLPVRAEGASPEDAAAAEVLFNQAIQLKESGQWGAACVNFNSSYRLDPATGTLHNIADCHAKAGRVASAWAAYRQVADEAEHVGNTRRRDLARRQAEALEPRLLKLVLFLPPEARVEGLRVLRDGTALDIALLGTPLPVDPGPHAIRAEAPGHAAWSTRVQLSEGETIEVKIPPLQPLAKGAQPASAEPTGAAPAAGAKATPASTVTVVVNQHDSAPPAPANPLVRQIVSGSFAALAVAGVITGAVYWKARGQRLEAAEQVCDAGLRECDDAQGPQFVNDAQRFQRWGIASWSAAGVFAVISLASWPWGSLQKRAAPSVRVYAGLQSVGVAGRF